MTLDAHEGAAVMKVCNISEFAAEAIERLHDDHVEDAKDLHWRCEDRPTRGRVARLEVTA